MQHPMDQFELIIFDADGTLRQCREHQGPCHNQDGQWEIIPGTKHVLDQYDWTQIGLGIATNQAPIAYGHTTADRVELELNKMLAALFQGWPLTPDRPRATFRDGDTMMVRRRRMPERGPVYRYAPHRSDASSAERKPSPWMILDLVRAYGARCDQTLYVGDSPEDQISAARAGVQFLWAWQFFNRPKQEPNTVKAHVAAGAPDASTMTEPHAQRLIEITHAAIVLGLDAWKHPERHSVTFSRNGSLLFSVDL